MCGIAGIMAREKQQNLHQEIDKMLETIIHRGPDGSGIEIFDDKIAFGHRRLAIIDLSSEGKQPMEYLNKYWITFNGEIYNYIELRKELENRGYIFRTKTDTEVLMGAYDCWGESCVERFNGMWAFAIYDKEKKIVFCSRDRFGIKPFYYRALKNKFIFASEIKEILSISDKPIYANREALEAYLARGILDCTELTMFKDIYQLQSGHNLIFSVDSNQYKIKKWYDIKNIKENRNDISKNQLLFKKKFFQSINFRLRSDVPIGSCLSGGLDSSAIVCAVHECLEQDNIKQPQYTVSSCFHDKVYDEQEYIDEVIKKTGVTSYKVFPEMENLFEELDKIIWHMDEPFGSTSIYAQWNVFKKAKEKGLTVMMDGQGADEQLAGYTPFYRILFLQLFLQGKWKKLWHEIGCYQRLRSNTETAGTFSYLMDVVLTAIMPYSILRRIKSVYRKTTVGLPFDKSILENKLIKQSEKAYNEKDSRAYIDASIHQGMQALLHYEDRDSMAHSIESRVPFLDYELAEFIYSVPMRQKIRDGKTKYIMREALRDIFPSAIYSRYSKLGFVTPEDKWLRENKEFIKNELEKACDKLAPMVDKTKVMNWYSSRVDKIKRGNFMIWRIICAAHWIDVFDVSIEP